MKALARTGLSCDNLLRLKNTARKPAGAKRAAKASTTTRVAPTAQPKAATRIPQPRDVSAPEIQIAYAPLGRDTLSAVADTEGDRDPPESGEETTPQSEGRIRQTTMGYSEPAPSARPPRPAAIYASAPEITVRHAPAGRETLAAINEELLEEPVTGVRATFVTEPDLQISALGNLAPLEIYEMLTFVLKGADVEHLSQEARRAFVLTRLRHRLPIASEDDLDRIDVTPWTARGTVMLRVWCRVRGPAA